MTSGHQLAKRGGSLKGLKALSPVAALERTWLTCCVLGRADFYQGGGTDIAVLGMAEVRPRALSSSCPLPCILMRVVVPHLLTAASSCSFPKVYKL